MMLALLSCCVLMASTDNVVARVDGRAITSEQVRARQAATRAAGGNAGAENLVEDIINEELLAAEGYRQGLDKAAPVATAADAARRKLASEHFVEKEVLAGLKVDDEQLKAMYHQTADSAQVLLIVRASEEEARSAVERLEKGADFAEEARHSLDPRGASRGGDQGTQSRGQLEAPLAQVAFSAPLGKVMGPVRLALGWGVVKVVARQIADEATFASRREALRRFALEQMRRQIRIHSLDQLMKKYQVTLDEAFLRATGTRAVATAEEGRHVLATVGSRSVRYQDIVDDLQSAFGGKESSHFSGFTVKFELLRTRVQELLLETAALEAGYAKDPAVLAGVRRAEHEAVVREMARKLREAVPQPTAAEVEAYYRQHLSEYTSPGKRTCSHLVVPTRGQAEELRRKALGGESFEKLAQAHSQDERTASRGGLLGDVTEQQLVALDKPDAEPALAAAFRSTRPDQVSQPVLSQSGWHLVKCQAPVSPQPRPLAEVKDAVSQRLRAEREVAAVRDRMTELRARAKVSVDRAAVQRLAGGAAPH